MSQLELTVYELLLTKAEEQLDKLTGPVENGEWFDSLLGHLKTEVTGADLPDEVLQASLEALDLLIENRDVLIGLGKHAFSLLLCQITCGKTDDALQTYVQALTNADDLIALMNSGTDGVIKAKIELDQLEARGKKLIFDILTAGLRYVIPFLLSLV